jgi:hypothetical protein
MTLTVIVTGLLLLIFVLIGILVKYQNTVLVLEKEIVGLKRALSVSEKDYSHLYKESIEHNKIYWGFDNLKKEVKPKDSHSNKK